MATLLRTVGTGLLVGSAGRGRLGISGVSPLDRRRAVDIQKTLYIDAPVEQVYAFWSKYENFPLFMSHVREVEDLGAGRSRWSVSGPGGVPIEWSAVLTQQAPDEVIAWRSEAGSMLENAGVIRFLPSGSGTRVNLRFCYHPPAGGAGQAVAELLGSDPRAKLNEDLGRMKALLEATTRSEATWQGISAVSSRPCRRTSASSLRGRQSEGTNDRPSGARLRGAARREADGARLFQSEGGGGRSRAPRRHGRPAGRRGPRACSPEADAGPARRRSPKRNDASPEAFPKTVSLRRC